MSSCDDLQKRVSNWTICKCNNVSAIAKKHPKCFQQYPLERKSWTLLCSGIRRSNHWSDNMTCTF